MKTGKKALLLALCAVLLVAATVMGTMAYLTSTATVTNTFTVGEDVKITLDEVKTDANGVALTPTSRTNGNAYKLMPGHTYTKDPTVHVTGEDCYVFVKVSNGISAVETAESAKTIAAQMAAKGWKVVDAAQGLYIYAVGTDTKTAVSKPTDLVVFENFTVKDDAELDDLSAVKDNTIVINAYAVQKDGFESSTPADIWAAAFAN